jgi:hypothetical protein
VRVLEEKLDESLERIARVLAMVYPPRDILSAHRALRSGSSSERAGAIELLDNLVEGSTKGELLSALDDVALGTRRRLRPDPQKTLAALLACDDRWLRACAAFTARSTGVLSEQLARLARGDADPLVREAARPAEPPDDATIAEGEAGC